MNRTHRSLWNPALGAWVAVPENARARGKRSRGASCVARSCALTAALGGQMLALSAGGAFAGVVGGIGVLALSAATTAQAQAQSLGLHGGDGGCSGGCTAQGGVGGSSTFPDGSEGSEGSNIE